jgi:hypothetical protein
VKKNMRDACASDEVYGRMIFQYCVNYSWSMCTKRNYMNMYNYSKKDGRVFVKSVLGEHRRKHGFSFNIRSISISETTGELYLI